MLMLMEKKSKIGILCHYSFPVGMAPTTRIIAYGKGLIQNGADVEVYSYYWRGDNSTEPLEGSIDGMKYIIPCRYHTKKGSFYHVFIDKKNIYGGTVKRIQQSHKVHPFDFFLISFDQISDYRYFLPKIAKMGIPMGLIADEYPGPIRRLKKKISFLDVLRFKYYHRYFSKRVLMTNALATYYNSMISPKPTFILNTVLDEKRFEGINRQPLDRPYLCYMGNMQLKKDNVNNIITAFSLIAEDFPEYDLYLYGAPDAEDKEIVEKCILQNGMTERVLLKGRLDYDSVPQVLVNASVLVTSQPDTKRAEGGFPTKMGEYMMTHVPMVVTDVGEIKQYVQDGDNTFMVPPEDPEAYAEKLRFIMNHPDIAKQVAERAYNYAISHFTAKEATKGMIHFLLS